MNNNKFYRKKEQGDIGVKFFKHRHNELLIHPVVLLKDMNDWDVEGSDLAGERLLLQRCICQDESGGKRDGLKPYLQYGGIEIKTMGPDQFLPRYNVDDIFCGTIGFPSWSKTEDLQNDRTRYLRDEHGNLKRWLYPTVENRGSRPMTITHLLETRDIDRFTGRVKKRFFAAIVFEDVEALFDRIGEYLLTFGLDIHNWSTIPTGEKARTLNIEGLFIQGNMVQIPLSVIGKLATVTMIGNDPQIYSTGRCSAKVQQSRLDYLKTLANGRWIPQEKPKGIQSDEELFVLWHQRLFFGNVQYPGLMDRYGNTLST